MTNRKFRMYLVTKACTMRSETYPGEYSEQEVLDILDKNLGLVYEVREIVQEERVVFIKTETTVKRSLV